MSDKYRINSGKQTRYVVYQCIYQDLMRWHHNYNDSLKVRFQDVYSLLKLAIH